MSDQNNEEPSLEELLERAKNHRMTPEEEEQQRRSFAYGNVKLSNPHVTRDMVNQIAEEMNAEDGQ